MDRRWSGLCFIGTGAALVVASVLLHLFHPQQFSAGFAPFPELFAAGLAAVLFWLRGRNVENREHNFWRLWALGCALWIVSDVLGMLAPPRPMHSAIGFYGLAFTFLPEVAMMAALVMRPELLDGRLRNPVVRYEAALVALWWAYLYLLFVAPWRGILPGSDRLWLSFIELHYFQNFALVLWLALLAGRSRGRWRRVYGHMACAVALFSVTIGPRYQDLAMGRWLAATGFDALLAAAFLWLALAALVRNPSSSPLLASEPASLPGGRNLLISATILGIPVLTIWCRFFSTVAEPVARFRLLISFATLVVGVLLVYCWQDMADRHRERMVGELESSVLELRRLQGQFAEVEKLSSLGQLAAGAAHEINNPVAAMLGYAELLHADLAAPPRVREMGGKIGEQARRIRNLVHNLLSLGEHTSFEEVPVDIPTLIRSAIELRRLGTRHREGDLLLAVETGGLEVRGDPEKLLQVFYRLLLDLAGENSENAVEVRARHDRKTGRVIVEFAERPAPAAAPLGPGLQDAQRAQRGVGLSLGVCFAIVKEHAGSIEHVNLSDGRRMFRVSLPVLRPAGISAEPAPAVLRS